MLIHIQGGSTPLHYAALHDHLEAMELLLEALADVEAWDRVRGSLRTYSDLKVVVLVYII